MSIHANLQLAPWPSLWAIKFKRKEYTLKATANQQPLFTIDKHLFANPLPAGQDDCHPKSIPGSNMCICIAIPLSSKEEYAQATN